MKRIDHKIAVLLIFFVFFGAGSALAYKYIGKNIFGLRENIVVSAPLVPEPAQLPVPEQTQAKISEAPPKHAEKQKVTTKSSGNVVTTIVSEGGVLAQSELDQIAAAKPSGSSPYDVKFEDKTGRYPTLEKTLKDYLNNNLRWGGEISSLVEIYVEDAGDTGWSGQYIGSYRAVGTDIISATGAIVLNTSYYKDLSQSEIYDYMRLILSHEYGHHYTQYHKWVDLDLPAGTRFPDIYYVDRPLSKSATTADCSTSWETCESEIIAEDYSYIYSGYNLHLMNDLYGYPSDKVRTWLDSLVNAQPTVDQAPPPPTPEPTPPPANENTNENTNVNENSNTSVPAANTNSNSSNTNTNTAVSDTEKPVVSFTDPETNPYSWSESVHNLVIKIRSTDNISVEKIKVYINDQFQGEAAGSGVNLTWPYNPENTPPGTYMLKAEAYDAAGNVGELSLTINKS